MDLRLVDNGSGGEVVRAGRDLKVIEGLENMPYLAICSGNVEASTPFDRTQVDEDLSWWGNFYLTPAEQFNSETERTLKSVTLNSAGRQAIQEAVKKDLAFMTDFADVSIVVSIESVDRCSIEITILHPGSKQRKEFLLIWDATNSELTTAL